MGPRCNYTDLTAVYRGPLNSVWNVGLRIYGRRQATIVRWDPNILPPPGADLIRSAPVCSPALYEGEATAPNSANIDIEQQFSISPVGIEHLNYNLIFPLEVLP